MRDGVTGVLFREQTVESLVEAMRTVQALRWDCATIAAHARRFDASVFRERMAGLVTEAWERKAASSEPRAASN